MIVVWDTDGSGRVWERLEKEIRKALPAEEISRQLTVEAFGERLARERRNIVAAVPVISGRRELAKLDAIRSLLSDIRLIMVLPDEEPKITSEVHRFYPRYIACMAGDFSDVGAVLKKMAACAGKKNGA